MRKTKYTVKPTTQFKKDFKLAMKRGLKIELLEEVISTLAMGEMLPEKLKDHALTGNWVGHRECHVRRFFSPQRSGAFCFFAFDCPKN